MFALLTAAPAFAQFRGFDVRPFALATEQRFDASTTFNAVFASPAESFWGGGVDVVVHKAYFVDLAISHMSKTGQRAFINNGQVFRLGIPLQVTMTPVELTGGFRFRFRRSRIIPYVGAGIGSYSYGETAGFSQPGDDVDARHSGFVMMGGLEFRVSRWVAITGDGQYTTVPGIFGRNGLSKDVGEDNLGGIAARLRVILGK
jgi:outer membrane protein W